VLGHETRCDGGKGHRVVHLETPEGREALFEEVWGPASLRRRARDLAKAGSGGAMLDGCGSLSSCDCAGADPSGEAAVIFLGLMLAFFVAVALYWLISKLIEYVRRRRARLKPKGALLAPTTDRGVARFGVVRESKAADSVAARAIELVQSRVGTNAVMLRFAHSQGFDVQLDDGSIVVIPPGRVRLEGTRSTIDDPSVARVVIDTTIGPPLEDPDGYSLIPFDVAQGVTLRVGDRVAIYGPLEHTAHPSIYAPQHGAFRSTSSVLAPVGTPSLARVDP
jgi:hypothetical protein